MTDTKLQRLNMVESQVRPSDVTDRRLLRAMGDIAREAFVPAQFASVAYMDSPVAIATDASGRTTREMMSPRTFAKLAQAADLEPDHAVMVGGCGSGYGVVVLSRIVRRVVGVEPDAALADRAKAAVAHAGVANATIVHGPIAAGSGPESPFDAIILEGAIADAPQALLDQLKDCGRLVAIVGNRSNGQAVVWTRSGTTFGHRDVFDATAAVLPGFEKTAVFAL